MQYWADEGTTQMKRSVKCLYKNGTVSASLNGVGTNVAGWTLPTVNPKGFDIYLTKIEIGAATAESISTLKVNF